MPNEVAIRDPIPISSAIEKAVLHGDLAGLSVDERLQYHRARCRAAGFNELARPFAYIRVRGEKNQPDRLVLYCLREGAEQLNQMHGITHSVTGIVVNEKGGTIEVTCQAQTRDGRSTFDMGCVGIQGLTGKDLAVAKMKAVTIAKRRATLSLCGLGDMMDASELENVRTSSTNADNGEQIKPDNGTGHGPGMYESEERATKFLELIDAMLQRLDAAWADRWQSKQDKLPSKFPTSYCNQIQLDRHLVKWAISTGRLDENTLPDDREIKDRQRGRLSAILWYRSEEDRKATAAEIKAYVERCQVELLEKLQRKYPELFETEPGDEKTDGEVMDDADLSDLADDGQGATDGDE
jgi:hypothetical protein